MRFIGSKTNLLDQILATIQEKCIGARSVIDIFAGSGAVTGALKKAGYQVFGNDFMYFSYVILRGTVQLNAVPDFSRLGIADPIAWLNDLTLEASGFNLKDCFIYQHYSPHDGCERMYFQNENAIRIDIIRMTIERWKQEGRIDEDGYFYLLAALIEAIPYVANIAGVYAAYLKFWDKRTYKRLTLEAPVLTGSDCQNAMFNERDEVLLPRLEADVLYSDSPYNSREYVPNYHILETIARYDAPELHGRTGMRSYEQQKSPFCKKATVHEAFETMIRKARVRYVVISYNNEGLISTEELSDICRKYARPGTFELQEFPYRRYKSKIPNNQSGLMEQIYFFEKKTDSGPAATAKGGEKPQDAAVYDKAPFNYIGNKYKILPQILPLFPRSIHTMVDLFAGGCDVCANVKAEAIRANDINYFVMDICKAFQASSADAILAYIDKTIAKWGLSETNEKAYKDFRRHYNAHPDPLDLYVLMCYSYNYQFRFNARREYNNPFGRNRSSFNPVMREHLIRFLEHIRNIQFTSLDFRDVDLSGLGKGDFVYCDPPYTITTGSYNDGKRGFKGWSAADDQDLFALLDRLHGQGAAFALSNVMEHKGMKNETLMEWARKYHVNEIDKHYRNSSYHGRNTDKVTREVLITNYEVSRPGE
jgi:adenine-specific DNA-methyltransferase